MKNIIFIFCLFFSFNLCSKNIVIDLDTLAFSYCPPNVMKDLINSSIENEKKINLIKLFMEDVDVREKIRLIRLNKKTSNDLYNEFVKELDSIITRMAGKRNHFFTHLDTEILKKFIEVFFKNSIDVNWFKCRKKLVEFLESNKESKKHNVCLVSNYPKEWVLKIFNKFNLYRFFKYEETYYGLTSDKTFWMAFFGSKDKVKSYADYLVLTHDEQDVQAIETLNNLNKDYKDYKIRVLKFKNKTFKNNIKKLEKLGIL